MQKKDQKWFLMNSILPSFIHIDFCASITIEEMPRVCFCLYIYYYNLFLSCHIHILYVGKK